MRLSILGSTGSIGCNTLQVAREMEGRVTVGALAAGRNVAELASQIREFQPELVSVADDVVRAELVEALGGAHRPEILVGQEGLLACVTDVDCGAVVSAAVGVVGLPATYEAVRRGKRVALANKEVLVAAGEMVMAAARESGAELLPVDSEHNALHQCLRAGRYEEVERLILTASGGPFRRTPRAELESVTPEQALRHPTWQMGARITIDSSTLMNKGFEVIEACLLFGFGADRVQVVVHPQSIVHAMVEYRDGSVIAQLGPPDMKLPIRYALTDPEREAGPPERRLRWDAVRNLEFEPPDLTSFPC
jgi:1-deoxy-D-xylulose-5-phosphate reductoisomerase